MHNHNHKGRASTLSKALLTAGLLGGATLGIIALSEAPAEALTTSLGKFKIEVEDGTLGAPHPNYGGTFFVDLLTDDDPVGNPALISKFGNSSYWLSHAPGSTKNFNVVLLPTGTGPFGTSGVAMPDGPTNNLIAKTINVPYVDGNGFIFAYLDNPGDMPISEDSYQIFSKPSSAPEGFSYYGCWGKGECVNAKMTHTPGPLPLLGVGAAFGFSRNLRKRIKGSKSPGVMSALG
jgi:hypothetical protein